MERGSTKLQLELHHIHFLSPNYKVKYISLCFTNIFQLDDVNDPNNVDWYKVVAGEEDVKIVPDLPRVQINKTRGGSSLESQLPIICLL